MRGPTLSSSCRQGMTSVASALVATTGAVSMHCVVTRELLRDCGTEPSQPDDRTARQCAAAAVEVLDGEGVIPFSQGGFERVRGRRVVGPSVDHHGSVH